MVIANNEKFVDPCHRVPSDVPLSLCDQFGCMNICIYLESASVSLQTAERTIASVLMERSREMVLPQFLAPSQGRTLRADQRLRNDVIGECACVHTHTHTSHENLYIYTEKRGEWKVSWSRDSVSVGELFMQKLTRALWYIDPHHSKFAGRSIHLPPQLGSLEDYNDYRCKKEKEPQLSVSGISIHVQELSGALMQPWFHHRRFELLRTEVEMLVEGLQKYCEYLKGRNEFMTEHHQSMTQSQLLDENTTLTNLPICSGLTHSDYADLEEKLHFLDIYKPVFLNDFSPADRFKHRKWMANLALPYPACIYRYAYGNNLGTLSYIWKIPYGPLDQTAVSQVFANLNRQQVTYSTRAMRRHFLQRYNRLVKTPKSVLCNIYCTLLNNGSRPSCSVEAEVDERVAKAVVNLDDPEIVLDLRTTNRKPSSTHFDQFWAELQAYMDEIKHAVDDRRHGDTLHLPFAISVRHLQEVISGRLREKHPGDCPPIPSLEWIRLQFWPFNQYTIRALKHTGWFNVKFAVQVRQLHRDHQDFRYVRALLQYVRAFAVHFRFYCQYVSVDDKATIPIGDPSCPLSTGVRGHNRSLVSLSGPQLHALDHDFHVCRVIPSVAFVVDIPESSADSFFSGQPFVVCKDKLPSHLVLFTILLSLLTSFVPTVVLPTIVHLNLS